MVEPINNSKTQPKKTDPKIDKKDEERRIQDILRMAKTQGVQQAIEQMKPAFHSGIPVSPSKKGQQR